jgi:hypothetical protein
MKLDKAFLTLLALVASSFTVCAQQTKLLTADKHNEYGLVYTLPVTAFDIEVTATREVRKAGPYYQYAKKYVGTDVVVKEDAEVWTIESVKVRPYGAPDNKSKYLMQLKPGATAFIGVAADGMLLSVNCNPAEHAPESAEAPREVEGEVLSDREYLQYVDEDFIASQSSAKQAQMLAESLMEIRDAKISLTRGTADAMPTDGKQLELMLNSLRHQEAAMTAAFLGNITKETVVRHYSFIPEEDGRSVLFRMSDFAGFVGADDYSGDPVYVNVNVTNEATLPVDSKGEAKKLPKDAVAYNVPGTAVLSLSFKGKSLFSEEYEMSQFGVVFGLSPDLFSDKKDPSYAVFDPATGALKEIGSMKDFPKE